MPAKNTTFRCLCSRCCEVDEEGVAHNQSGKLIPMANKAAHLQRVQSRISTSSEQRQQAVETLVREEMEQLTSRDAVDAIGARVFTLTLTDEGPDLSSQTSKLWTSREDFQHNVNSHAPTDVVTPSLNDLAESFTRLAINSNPRDKSSRMGQNSSEPASPSHPTPPLYDTDSLVESPSSLHQSFKNPTSSAVPRRTTSKPEGN